MSHDTDCKRERERREGERGGRERERDGREREREGGGGERVKRRLKEVT